MGIDLVTWRARIGLNSAFNFKMCNLHKIQSYMHFFLSIICMIKLLFNNIDISKIRSKFICLTLPYLFLYLNYWWLINVIICCGDIELNPGPLKFCHWNLNSMCTENFSRKTLIESFNVDSDYDIIAISESALHDSIDNEQISIAGYEILRRDIPLNTTHGGILVYHKDTLAVKERPDIEFNENQLIMEITIEKKKIIVSVNYRRHHHDVEELHNYKDNLKKTLKCIQHEDPFCSLHLGDFNSHQKQWWGGDTDDMQGDLLNDIIASENLFQLVKEPTHITGSSLSCIDLVITDQPNLINNCAIMPSLHTRCHHQINHVELNIKNPPPPSYIRRIWHYQRAKENLIKKAITSFNWERELGKLTDRPNEQAKFFSETLLNIFSNFIPNQYKTIKPRDPPWFSKNIKIAYRKYQRTYKKFKKRDNLENPEITFQKKIYTDMVLEAKGKYLSSEASKLMDQKTTRKSYWTILKKFINSSKMPRIPPLLIQNTYITDFQDKSKYFNEHFANQCSVLETGSQLPNLTLHTDKTLNDVLFHKSDLFDVIKNLDPSKAHGWDEISIKMIKLGDTAIIDPLFVIFKNCIAKGIFPEIWKRANVIPIHKKSKKDLLKNYRPISLLPIFGKIFERIIFKSLYSYLIDNKLISSKQSGFIKGDSTINQLLSITDMINSSFDCDIPKEVRSVFLDISKAFDKVWHPGLLFKLKQNGIGGDMFNILHNFLSDRKQRVNLNGKVSTWKHIDAGVPQGSVLGPILFLIYINDLISGLKSDARVFADDSSLFVVVDDPITAHQILQDDLNHIENWARQWRFEFNPDPIKPPIELIFSTKIKPQVHPTLYFHNIALIGVEEHKHLGLILDKKLTFNSHIKECVSKAKRSIGALKISSRYLPTSALDKVYKSYIRPKLEYGDIIYHKTAYQGEELKPLCNLNLPKNMEKLESVQYQAALVVSGTWQGTSKIKLYNLLGWEFLSHRRWFRQQTLFYKIVTGLTPQYLASNIKVSSRLKNKSPIIHNVNARTKRYLSTFFPSSIHSWNVVLSAGERNSNNIQQFKSSIKIKIRPSKTDNFGIDSKKRLKYLNQLRVGLSSLKMHKYRHKFSDTEDAQCPYKDGVESNFHFLLECKNFYPERKILFNTIFKATKINLLVSHHDKEKFLLYGDPALGTELNKKILEATIAYIEATGRLSKF